MSEGRKALIVLVVGVIALTVGLKGCGLKLCDPAMPRDAWMECEGK